MQYFLVEVIMTPVPCLFFFILHMTSTQNLVLVHHTKHRKGRDLQGRAKKIVSMPIDRL